MKSRIFVICLATGVLLPGPLAAKEKKPAGPTAPIGWLDLQSGSRKSSVSGEDLRRASRNLPRGALLPVFRTKEKHGAKLAQVGLLNLDTGNSELAWVEVNSDELKPQEAFPADNDLLQLLGPPYLDDFTAEHTDIARFLVRQTQGPRALLCYVVTVPLSMAKLVVFTPRQGKFLPGAALSIPISDMKAGITSIEIRNLTGDGSECVITQEPFREGAQTSGVTLFIRKIEDSQFRVLWQAPIEFRNLSQYGSKLQILQPPERNIGAPGTVTTGNVTFRPSGTGQEPVWKGKVEFFVFGREKAADSIEVEKACPWDGKEFAPLR